MFRELHVPLRRSLGDVAVLAQPIAKMAMRNESLGGEQQFAGVERMTQRRASTGANGLMLGSDAGGQIGQ
jgi:hypothetical protein